MKKALSILALLMACVMILSLAACGEDKTDSAKATSDSAAVTEATANPAEVAKTLDEFIQSDDMKKQKKKVEESLEGKMTVDFTVDGTTLVITYTLTQEFLDSLDADLSDEDKESIKGSMSEYLEGQGETIDPMKKAIQNLGVADPAVKVQIVGPDGYDYGSKTF